MPLTPFTLDQEDLAALDAVGLRLPGLRQARRLHGDSWIEAPGSIIASVIPDSRIEIGAFCNISGGTLSNVAFGRYCSVAAGVVVGPHEHPTDWLTTSRTAYYPEVNGWDRLLAGEDAVAIHEMKASFATSCPQTVIGNDVWIGQGAFVKAGVRIGDGAIIGARATVLKDVPAYAVMVGTPARVVRTRFAEPIVERLLTLSWWRYSIYDLFTAPMNRIEDALDTIEDLVARGAVAPYRGRLVRPADLAAAKTLAAEMSAEAASARALAASARASMRKAVAADPVA